MSIADHYTSGNLMQRLQDALRSDGADPDNPTLGALIPYDQFHGRGLEATEELAAALHISVTDHLLDVGSGIGGPARYFANRFGCQVTGIDLTEEFCDVARQLNRLTGLNEKVRIEQGNALNMPFEEGKFSGAYSMNVSMNIEDKLALYREILRVLRPGGWLVLSEVARGTGSGPDYPTPWALTEDSSFLATPEETKAGLMEAGFNVTAMHDKAAESTAFATKSKEAVERGAKPPHRAVKLIHGKLGTVAMQNMAAASKSGAVIPIEVFCTKPGLG